METYHCCYWMCCKLPERWWQYDWIRWLGFHFLVLSGAKDDSLVLEGVVEANREWASGNRVWLQHGALAACCASFPCCCIWPPVSRLVWAPSFHLSSSQWWWDCLKQLWSRLPGRLFGFFSNSFADPWVQNLDICWGGLLDCTLIPVWFWVCCLSKLCARERNAGWWPN